MEKQMQLDQQTIAHLGFIQNVITRMASNSLSLKIMGVSVTTAVTTVIATLGADKANALLALFCLIIPNIAFLILDARYLQQERQYRALYDAVRKGNAPVDFAMNSEVYKRDVPSLFKTCISWSVIWVYPTVLIAGVFILGLSYIKC